MNHFKAMIPKVSLRNLPFNKFFFYLNIYLFNILTQKQTIDPFGKPFHLNFEKLKTQLITYYLRIWNG